MYKLKKIVAALIIYSMVLSSSGLYAFGEDSGEPAAESATPETTETSESVPADTETEYIRDENIAEYSNVMDVLLPYDISFDIVILNSIKKGIVASKEFKVVNTGAEDVTVKIVSAYLKISDEENFSLSDTANLPEDGNNMYIELMCSSGDSHETFPLKGESGDTEYTYYLESGGKGTFWLEGVVNEFGDIPWSDTSVTVSLCFSMEDDNAEIAASRGDRAADLEEAAESEETTETIAGIKAESTPEAQESSEVKKSDEPTQPSESEQEAIEASESEGSEETDTSSKRELDTDESSKVKEADASSKRELDTDESSGAEESVV